MGLRVFERVQALRKTPETELVAEGRQAIDVCLRDFNCLPFDRGQERPENVCGDGRLDLALLHSRAFSQSVSGLVGGQAPNPESSIAQKERQVRLPWGVGRRGQPHPPM
jgi:hypothetical protein